MAGTGAIVKGGEALARGGGAMAQALGKALATGPGLQTVSAATGAGAAGVTREEGGGAGAQLAAGLAGAIAPGAATAPFRRVATVEGRQVADAARKANDAGYVIPPADLTPGIITEALSGVSGKIKTAQQASARNQQVTNSLIRKNLGIPEGQPLTVDTLNAIRAKASQAYGQVASAGIVTPSAKYTQALDDAVAPFTSQANSFPGMKVPGVVADIQSLKSPQFDAGDALNTIRVLRNSADTAYRSGDAMVGKAYRNGAGALEQALEDHLAGMGAPANDILKNFRHARQTIAKTYTVEAALNPTKGDVSAPKLAAALTKGKPLSGEMRTVAEMGQGFPKAAQALAEAPKQVSVLDAVGSATAALSTGNPLYLAAYAARPLARGALLSGPMQSAAVKRAGTAMQPMPPGAAAIAVGATTRPPQPTASDIMNTETVDDAIGAAMGATGTPAAGARPASAFTGTMRPDGTYMVNGDPDDIRARLREANLYGLPANGGMLVGRSNAAAAEQLFRAPDPAPEPEPEPVPAEPSALDLAAHQAAASPQNERRGPTSRQFDAGNFRMGHAVLSGVSLSIEHPEGSTRRGVDQDGNAWENDVPVHRGYVRGTRDSDGGKLAALVNPGTPADYRGPVFVIDQKNPRTGAFDQHIAVFGAKDEKEASEMYQAGFPAGWEGMGGMSKLPLTAFKSWAKSDQRKGSLSE